MFKYLVLSFLLMSTTVTTYAAKMSQKSCEINETSLTGQYAVILRQFFGNPNNERNFQIKDVADEFRIELLNIYPPTNPANLEVRIWEWTWNHGDCRTTVWFDKKGKMMESILAYGWHKDEEH